MNEAFKFCPECGTENTEGRPYCGNCGFGGTRDDAVSEDSARHDPGVLVGSDGDKDGPGDSNQGGGAINVAWKSFPSNQNAKIMHQVGLAALVVAVVLLLVPISTVGSGSSSQTSMRSYRDCPETDRYCGMYSGSGSIERSNACGSVLRAGSDAGDKECEVARSNRRTWALAVGAFGLVLLLGARQFDSQQQVRGREGP